jgi:TolB-like protein
MPFRLPDEPGTASVLGDAVAAEVTQHLSRLHWLRVVARESSFRFRAAEVDLPGLHTTLGADYAIAGALWREAGNRWSAQVDLSHTVSQTVLWTDRITGDIGDVAAFRDTIAAAVLAALELRVPLHQAEAAQRKPFEMLDAWEAFHLGLRQVYRFTRAGNAEAARLFERATSLDPYFAAAYAARSFASFQDATMSYTADRAGAVADVRRFAERAIEIDPLDPSSNFAMGRNLLLSRDAEGAIDWLDRALALNPNYAKAHYSRGFAKLWSPQLDGARASFAASIQLSPLDPLMGPMLSNLGAVALAEGRLTEAADLTARGARRAPNHFLLSMIAAATAAQAGDLAAASRWREAVLALMPGASVAQFCSSVPYLAPGLGQMVSEGLRLSGFPE